MPRLVRLVASLWDATDAYRSLYYVQPANRENVLREHRAVLDALRAGAVEQAVRLLDEHRAHAVAALEETLQTAGAG
jgi:DNA-binding GntR family transcriptional regulator